MPLLRSPPVKLTKLATLISVLLGLLAPAAAGAADRVYFGTGSSISYANLDGSGGGDLETGAATVEGARGIAIDPAAGRIYWANGGGGKFKISWANLDGSDGGDLPISGASVNYPYGVALDLTAGRIYWVNYQGPVTDRIAYANLDGSGGGYLPTTGATVANPEAVAIDPAAGRIYWSNETGPISYAALDGSGGDDVNTSGAETGDSEGVAIDSANQRVYWTSHKTSSPYAAVISSAGLDESGGSDLATPGATLSFPAGVAIDQTAGRIYWANTAAFLATGSISYAPLEGGSGGNLSIAGATSFGVNRPALLKAPVGTGAPKLTLGIATRPRFLACDQGTWATDMPEALLYRAPHSFSYQWLRDGQPIAGATRSNIGVEGTGGDFECQVTATNAAGATTQTSRAQFVCCRPSPKARADRVALVKGGKARLKLHCPDGTEPCAGRLRLESTRRPRKRARSSAAKLPKLPVTYGERSFSVPPGKERVVKVKLSRGAMSKLRSARRHRLNARLDGRAVESRTVLLKLAPKHRKHKR